MCKSNIINTPPVHRSYLLECKGAENCQDALKGHFRTLQFLLLALLGSHSQEKRIIKPWAKIPRGKDPKRCRRAASPRLFAFSYEKKG